jgi:hypothetical protein
MTDLQLYLAIGLPVFAILMNIAVTGIQVTTINARITSLETAVNNRINGLESAFGSRFNTLEMRFTGLETRFDTLIGKVIEIDTRLTRVEERLEHL